MKKRGLLSEESRALCALWTLAEVVTANEPGRHGDGAVEPAAHAWPMGHGEQLPWDAEEVGHRQHPGCQPLTRNRSRIRDREEHVVDKDTKI